MIGINKRPDIELNQEELLAAAERWHFEREAFPEIQEMYRALFPLLDVWISVAWEAFGDSSADHQAKEKVCGCGRKTDRPDICCAVTIGSGIDILQERCGDRGDVTGAYILECLGSVLLEKAYLAVDELIYENTGWFVQEYLFPGDGGIPLSENERILKRIQHAGSGERMMISCSDMYVLKPGMSVAFLAVPGTDKREGHLCGTCSSRSCPNRIKSRSDRR